MPKGESHELPLSEKLRMQLAWDARVLELDRFLKPATVPRDVINSFDEQMQREGWKKCVLVLSSSRSSRVPLGERSLTFFLSPCRVKVALAHLIRGAFVAAYVNQMQLRAGASCGSSSSPSLAHHFSSRIPTPPSLY